MDRDGKAISKAVILAENPNASPSTFSATADSKGAYSLAGIKPGAWKLTVSSPGFVPKTMDIVVEDNGNIRSSLIFILARRRHLPPCPPGDSTARSPQAEPGQHFEALDTVASETRAGC